MQIRNLQLFCDLVQTQSFTRAADKNYLTQSAITQILYKLECNIDEPLVLRGGHQFQLTPAGEIYYLYASEIVRLYDEAVRRVGEVANDNATREFERVLTDYLGKTAVAALGR